MSSADDDARDANAYSEVAPAAIELIDVAKTYPGPPTVDALHPFSLTICRGDFIAISGPSGSGKSTLLNILGLLDEASTGIVVVDGVSVNGADDETRTKLRGQHIGFVFQAFHLVDYRTAVENVGLALLYQGVRPGDRLDRSLAALERVGLAQRAHAVAGRMSGGERQRVAIARAIVHEPTLLLCDEPTGNLDSANAHSVLAMLEELNAVGSTVILVTHDPDVAARAKRHVSIRDGVVCATTE